MAKKGKYGAKHRLFFVRHSVDRIWRALLILDIVIWAAWWFAPVVPTFYPPKDRYLWWAGILFTVVALLLFFLRNQAYVQARHDHMRIALPFRSVKIPYRVVDAVRTNQFDQIYTVSKLGWANRRFLEPYRGSTVLTLRLKRWPRSRSMLGLLLPNYLFLPNEMGFLFLIRDWMGFSTELDSRLSVYRDTYTEDEESYEGYEEGFYAEDKHDDQDEGLFNLFGE